MQPLKSNKSLVSGMTPAKGILKKATSNPQLAQLDMQERAGAEDFDKRLPPDAFFPTVVDINKYLKQAGGGAGMPPAAPPSTVAATDAWSTAGTMRDPHSPPKSLTTMAPENDYMSDVASNSGDNRQQEELDRKRHVREYVYF